MPLNRNIIHPRVLGINMMLVGVGIPRTTKANVPQTLEKFILCIGKNTIILPEVVLFLLLNK